MEPTHNSLLYSPAFSIILLIVTYIAFCMPLYTMGEKTGASNSWFAFVPILNIVLMLDIAGKDLWWIILLLIPCVNIIVLVVVWMSIAEAMDKPSWLGILMLVPVVSWVLPFYIAYG